MDSEASPGDDSPVKIFTRAVNIEKSFKVLAINDDYALWQIGKERLEEFTRCLTRVYDSTLSIAGGGPPPGFAHYMKENLEWYERSLFMSVIGPDGIASTGIGIKLWDGRTLFETQETRAVFDVPGLIEKYHPDEIWYGLRNSMDNSMFNGNKRIAYRAYKVMIEYTVNNFYQTPNLILLSLVQAQVRERYKRMNMNWLPAGDTAIHRTFQNVRGYPIRLMSRKRH